MRITRGGNFYDDLDEYIQDTLADRALTDGSKLAIVVKEYQV